MGKKTCSWLLAVSMALLMFLSAPMTAAADGAIIIGTGDYSINEDGIYQLANGYSGLITISAIVNAVEIIGAADGSVCTGASISIAGVRTGALELTIENLRIIAPDNYHGINYASAGNFDHELYVSGSCSITGDNGYQFGVNDPGYFHLNSYYGAGIRVPTNVQLSIDKVLGLTDAQAQLIAIGGNQGAGIGGGGFWQSTDTGSGTITINGGTIVATGGWAGAGIGGGYAGIGGTTTINGGVVTANGNQTAGIGGGFARSGGLTTINNGIVSAVGSYAAGIEGSQIDINGGTITAMGGRDDAANGYPGIGSSDLAIDSSASVQAYSQTTQGTYQAISGNASTTGHSAYLLNFCLNTPVPTDTEVTIAKQGLPSETITLTIPSGFQNFATTVDGGNTYRAELTDGTKYIALVTDDSRDFTSTLTPSESAIDSLSVKFMGTPVCRIGTTGYTDLSDALNAVTSGQTIRLLTDITYNDRIWAGSSYRPSLTLDLNGYKLEISDVEVPIAAIDGRSINITDDSVSGGGTLDVSTTSADSAPTGITAAGTGSHVSVNAKVSTNITSTAENGKGVSAYTGGSVEIGNASITVPISGSSTSVYADGVGSSISITGDVSGGWIGAYTAGGTVSIVGDVTTGYGGSGSGVRASGGTISVTGDVSSTGGGNYGAFADNGGTINITGNVTSGSVGAAAYNGSQITIGGRITYGVAYIEIGFDGNYLNEGNFAAETTKAGYLTYTYGDPVSTVLG